VEGAVTVQPLAKPVTAFDEYFLKLRPENNSRNPWFIEYWESYFKCKYPQSPYTPLNEDFVINCTDNMTQSYQTGYMPEAQLQFVSDAVLAFAYAIKVWLHTFLVSTDNSLGHVYGWMFQNVPGDQVRS
jgi:hypothetical protein